MTTTNEHLFIKQPPKVAVGHRPKPVKQDNFGLFREMDNQDIYILNTLLIKRLKDKTGQEVSLQVDVILSAVTQRGRKGIEGITYVITPNNPQHLDAVDKYLRVPTVRGQLQGYTFTYNMMAVLQGIPKSMGVTVKRYTDIMKKEYLEYFDATPNGYIITTNGIIGYNTINFSGYIMDIYFGDNVIMQAYPELNGLSKERKAQAQAQLNYYFTTKARGRVTNLQQLSRELLVNIKSKVFTTPVTEDDTHRLYGE